MPYSDFFTLMPVETTPRRSAQLLGLDFVVLIPQHHASYPLSCFPANAYHASIKLVLAFPSANPAP